MYVQMFKKKGNHSRSLSKDAGNKPTKSLIDNRGVSRFPENLDSSSRVLSPRPESVNSSNTRIVQLMSWQQSKSLVENDYNDPVGAGVSSGGVWMYVLKHINDSSKDIRVHYHAGSSKGSKTWTVRWNSEGSGNNVATQKWMRDRVNAYYYAHQS